MDTAQQTIYEVSEGKRSEDYKALRDLLEPTYDEIEAIGARGGGLSGVPTGFAKLDELTNGLHGGQMIIIAARPSMGKTAFVLSMARNMAVDHEQGVAFFSLEMSSVQLMMRLIIAETGLNGNDVKSGRLTPEQWRHLESATKPLGAAPLFIDDTPALSVFEFRSKARRLKIHNDIKIIVIDYLQLMTGNQDSKGNREQEVAFISRTLKAIAKELNVPVIALSQLNRSLETRTDKRPVMADLRESGAIEQDADIIMFIYRDDYYNKDSKEPNVAEVIIGKQRNGPTGTVKLFFQKNQTRFENLAMGSGDDY